MTYLRYLSRELIAQPAMFLAWVFADFIALGIKKDAPEAASVFAGLGM